MYQHLVPILLASAAILPAAEGGKGAHHELGTVIGRQVIDAGHVLEVRALPENGLVLIRWGDVDHAIPKGGATAAFTWDGGASVSSGSLSVVRTVRFEDGSGKTAAAGKGHDQVTADGYGGQLSWKARTRGAWDGIVVRVPTGSQLSVHAGTASLAVATP